MDTENTTEINQEEKRGRNFGRRHVIFYVYLVLVIGAFAGFCYYKIYGDRKRAEITENSQIKP